MSDTQYCIGTVSFTREGCVTWGARSEQVLAALAHWGREGWRISRLSAAAHIRLHARGFCVLLERPIREIGRKGSYRSGGACRGRWAA